MSIHYVKLKKSLKTSLEGCGAAIENDPEPNALSVTSPCGPMGHERLKLFL